MPDCAQRREEWGRRINQAQRTHRPKYRYDLPAERMEVEREREGAIEPPKVHINNVKMLRMSVQQVGDKLTRGFYAKLCKVCSCRSVCV